ncbi:MAG: crossover junction endodeoxyribonuclease RuvC [Myxococcota bacterium]
MKTSKLASPPRSADASTVRILGIDPGTRKTGWGVVERRGTRLMAIASGILRVPAKAPLPARLHQLHAGLEEVIGTFEPAAIALEDIFFAKYANAAMKLGHARGVAMLVCAQHDLTVHEFPPALVKRTVTGRGNAPKEQVARLVTAVLGLRETPGEDAADALAAAITCLQAQGKSVRLLKGSRR